jgi:hypothetical protein
MRAWAQWIYRRWLRHGRAIRRARAQQTAMRARVAAMEQRLVAMTDVVGLYRDTLDAEHQRAKLVAAVNIADLNAIAQRRG